MTKQQILDGLEGLKELINANGKIQIDGLKAAIMMLEEVIPEMVQKEVEAQEDESTDAVIPVVSRGTKRKKK